MNIFFREMKANRKSLIIWCIGILFMIAAGIGKYTGYSNAGESMNDLLAQIPESIKAIIGMSSLDVTKISGFYGMLYLYLTIMAAIHSSMLGANIIAREERDKTAEFLYVKPVSRNRVITSKISAALVNVVIFNLVTFSTSAAVTSKYSKGENIAGDIAILMAGMFILQLIFLFIGTGTAAIGKNPKTAASAATGLLLAAFILSVIVDVNKQLGGLRYITPFKYFEAKNLMNGKGFEPVFIILSGVIISTMILSTYIFYKNRDLKI